MGDIRKRLASVTLFACIGLLAGCGDDLKAGSDGGAGTTGGGGGSGAGGGGNGGNAGGSGGSGGGIGGAGGGGNGGNAGTSAGGSGGGGAGGRGGGGGGGTAGGGSGGGGASGSTGTGGGGNGGRGGSGGGGASGSTGTGGGGNGGRGGSGGSTGTGGGGTSGSTGTGGGGTSGSTGTGGGGASGSTGTGGGASGSTGTGGGASGSTGTGGGGASGSTGTGGGGTGGTACYAVTFTAPTNNQTLTVAQDKNSSCSDGLQFDVTITTGAPAGTDVSLYNNGTLVTTVQVANGGATFPSVNLGFTGTAALQIQFPSTAACTDPSTAATVTVSCSNTPPTCNVTQPTISATHPDLNGVQAPAGDRTSSPGSPYQATFVVTTTAEDGQPISLQITDDTTSAVTNASATASGGSASAGVTLVPDLRSYDVVATCTNRNGISATSAKQTFPVDYTPPDLTVSSPTDGQFFGPSQLSNGAFQVCGQTTSMDAANLPASLGAGKNNFCVSLGTSTSCTAVLAVSTPTCIGVACPGGAPFNLTVTLSDGAGNPTTKTITGVSCASSLPSVQIVTPVSDGPGFGNPARRILSATSTVGIPDKDGTTPGAQADVVACTDTSGTAALLVGHVGDAVLSQLGGSVPTSVAVAADNCPAGLGFAAHFTSVKLPESTENADGTLAAGTRIEVAVSSSSQPITGTSAPVDVWVDSVAPAIALSSPAGLCGSFQQAPGAVTQSVAFVADDALVTVQVVNNGSTSTYNTPTYAGGIATFANVVFNQGGNDVSASVADPAGNVTAFATTPCTVTIGAGPVVNFTSPTGASILCPVGATATGCIDDADGTTGGWQGSLTVHVTASGQAVTSGNVTFAEGSTTLGTAAIDSSGNATLAGVTLADGSHTIDATTDPIPNAGVGTGTVTVSVDLTPPNAPSGLQANVLDRRATSMQLVWTAPSDANGGNVTGYQVRYAKVAIDATNFDNASVTTAVTYGGVPSAAGQLDGIAVPGLYIENGYYFAVAATDGAGNRSAITASPGSGTCTCGTQCCAAHFNVSTMTGTSGLPNEQFGVQLDGTGDVNGDGLSDLLIGSSNGKNAYLFFGTNGNFAPSVASVVFTGDPTATGFGRAVAQIGDIDGDGREDLAIAATSGATPRVFIYKGRANWPLTLSSTNADYVISGNGSYAASALGVSMARLGDFNGDGVDDFAIGASGFATAVGRVVIILGKSGFASVALPDVTNAITIDGDSTLTFPVFGARVLGLGQFYSGAVGQTLIVAAPGNAGSNSSQGRIYSFRGQTGSGGAIPLASADNVLTGPASNTDIGIILSNLGPMRNSLPSIGSGNPADTATGPGMNGSAYILSGTATGGPFVDNVILTRAGATRCGQVVLGGGISGRNVSYSLIGSASPDLTILPQSASSIQIIDGTVISGLGAGPTDTGTIATVTIPLGAGWGNTGTNEGTLIPDLNGDGHPDFAIANAIGAVPGTAAVYW